MVRRRMTLSAMVVALASTILLSGCAPTADDVRVPPRAAIVGVWVHGSGPSSITFFSSGAVRFTLVPKQLLYGKGPSGESPHKGPWTDLISVSGTWRAPSGGSGGLPTLTGGVNHVGYELFVLGNSVATWRVVMVYGDDLEFDYAFKRVANAPPTEGAT